jgi:hypothetical protein
MLKRLKEESGAEKGSGGKSLTIQRNLRARVEYLLRARYCNTSHIFLIFQGNCTMV